MSSSDDLSTMIGAALPYLRRYARALTGDQKTGDNYAAAALAAVLADREVIETASSVKVGLFTCFDRIWKGAGAPVDDTETGLRARAQKHLRHLTTNSREALLLSSIESFSLVEVAEIMGVSDNEAAELVDIARREMADAVSGSLMIIEDEPIIAMDLEAMVAEMGHRVTGIARTHADAVTLVNADAPDLILADIQLADSSSGIDAVNEILGRHADVPVIFITAFPERLLTGQRTEPAFLISKPFTEPQIRSAVSQAMFFASTETLQV